MEQQQIGMETQQQQQQQQQAGTSQGTAGNASAAPPDWFKEFEARMTNLIVDEVRKRTSAPQGDPAAPGSAIPTPNVNPTPTTQAVPPAPQPGANAMDQLKELSRDLNNNRFELGRQRWSDWINGLTNILYAHAIDPQEPSMQERLKAMIYKTLDREAQKVAAEFNPTNRAVRGYEFIDYLSLLGTVFSPPTDAYAAQVEYNRRKQRKNEPVVNYISIKHSLYMESYGRKGYDWEHVKKDVILGLLNPAVRENMWNVPANTVSELQKAANQQVNFEILKLMNGQSFSNTWDGLASDYMDKVNYTKRSSTPQGGVHHSEESEVANVDTRGRRRCYDCGSFTHFRNSQACKEKGAGKFQPKANRGGRGRRGRGAARGGQRGRSGPYRFAGVVNHLGEVEAYTEEILPSQCVENVPKPALEMDGQTQQTDELPFLGHSPATTTTP